MKKIIIIQTWSFIEDCRFLSKLQVSEGKEHGISCVNLVEKIGIGQWWEPLRMLLDAATAVANIFTHISACKNSNFAVQHSVISTARGCKNIKH